MSFRHLLAALVAVSLAGCLLPVQTPSDGKPALPDGGTVVGNDGDGGNTQTDLYLSRVQINQPVNGSNVELNASFYIEAVAIDQKEGNFNSGTTFEWSTSGAGTISLTDTASPYQQVTATGSGSITLSVKATHGDRSQSASITFTVNEKKPDLASITVATAPTTMKSNESLTAAFEARDINNAVVDPGEVDFDSIDSTNKAALTVNRDAGGVAFHAQPNGGQSNWTLVAHRRGTTATASTGGTVTVTIAATNRIVVGTISQTTSAGNCLPTNWGVQPTTSGTLTAVAVGGECAPYSGGELDWSVTPTGVITLSGTGATVSWNAVSDGHATVTAKSPGDNGVAFTATLDVTSTYPTVIQVDGSCTMGAQTLHLNVGEQKALTLAKFKGPGSCDASDNNVTWTNNFNHLTFSSTSGSQVTVTGANPGSAEIGATLQTYGTGTSINYTVANVPAPTFGVGTLAVQWLRARQFQLAWPTATLSGGTVEYKLSGTSSAGKYAEKTVSGTSTTVDVPAAASDWVFTLQACNSGTTSCVSKVSSAYPATAPAAGFFTALGSDGGYYSINLDGTSYRFLGLPATAPTNGLTTAPRVDAAGNLYAIGYVAAGEKTVLIDKGSGSLAAVFTAGAVDLGLSLGNCTIAQQPQLTAFPISGSQVAFLSGSSRIACGAGELVVTPYNSSSQVLVASDVSSAAVAGASLDTLGYIYRGTLFVVDATTASTAIPTVLTSNVTGQLLGTNNGLYTFSNANLKQFDTTSMGQSGNAVTVAPAATNGFDIGDLDATQPAYGLPTGELVFALKTSAGGGFGVATPSDATHFTGLKVGTPFVSSGVTFTLGTMVLP